VGSNLTFSQLESTWTTAAVGTSYDTTAWAALMAAIALAESSGNPDATNPDDNNGTQTSYGLWQISNGTHDAPDSNWATPADNATLAVQKLESQGLSAWGTYTSGAYQSYLPSGTALPTNATDTDGTGTATGTGATATSATGNPLTWLTAPIKGLEWAGNWITGGQIGSITSEAEGLSGIVTGLSGLVSMISKLGQLWLILFRPQFWLRIGAFIVGIVALIEGLHFMRESL
jgi:hypothetical protein